MNEPVKMAGEKYKHNELQGWSGQVTTVKTFLSFPIHQKLSPKQKMSEFVFAKEQTFFAQTVTIILSIVMATRCYIDTAMEEMDFT